MPIIMPVGTIALIILIVLVLLLIVSNIVVVQQSKAYVVERLGAFRTVWNVGLHFKMPFIERVSKKVSLKEQVADFAPQPVITKDNVTMTVCPALRAKESRPLPAVFAAWNKDDIIRKDSTSGGLFSLIAQDTLECGGVVFGAALDSKLRLRHIACFEPEDLRYLRGAKYVQSDLRGTYREVRELLKSRPVLFSGTPCQVDGLYHFLGNRPENLTTCDLVCQGVPSPGVWADMDVKNSLSKYPSTVGIPGFDTSCVQESAALLMEGRVDYEFRTTLVREFHTEADLLCIAHWLEGAKRHCLQNFVDSGTLIQSGLHGFFPQEMHAFAEVIRPYFADISLRGVD